MAWHVAAMPVPSGAVMVMSFVNVPLEYVMSPLLRYVHERVAKQFPAVHVPAHPFTESVFAAWFVSEAAHCNVIVEPCLQLPLGVKSIGCTIGGLFTGNDEGGGNGPGAAVHVPLLHTFERQSLLLEHGLPFSPGTGAGSGSGVVPSPGIVPGGGDVPLPFGPGPGITTLPSVHATFPTRS